jgi:endogenous inhibitor of DNA gyrase (YacG/DUF329 family)
LNEEELIAWQDVLDEIAAGRSDNLACPYCSARPLQIEREDQRTRVSCPQCKKFIEGAFQAY